MRKSKISAKNPLPSTIKLSKHHSRKSKLIPKIDDTFFENLFILEMNYLKTLNPDYINQIVTHYMMAIEFYEYKKDPKCEDYQNRLRFFMIQPDVIKFLNKKKQPNQNTLKSSKRVVRRKNEYKIKFDYLSKINFASGAGKETLNQAKKRFGKERREEIEKQVNNLISKDIDNQSKSYKERLQRRKNKQNQIVMNKIKGIDSKIESEHQSPRRVDTEIKEEDEDDAEIDIKRVQTEAFDNDEDDSEENVVNVDTFEDFIAENEIEDQKEEEEQNEIFPSNQIENSIQQYKSVSDSDDDSIDSEESSLDNNKNDEEN